MISVKKVFVRFFFLGGGNWGSCTDKQYKRYYYKIKCPLVCEAFDYW